MSALLDMDQDVARVSPSKSELRVCLPEWDLIRRVFVWLRMQPDRRGFTMSRKTIVAAATGVAVSIGAIASMVSPASAGYYGYYSHVYSYNNYGYYPRHRYYEYYPRYRHYRNYGYGYHQRYY